MCDRPPTPGGRSRSCRWRSARSTRGTRASRSASLAAVAAAAASARFSSSVPSRRKRAGSSKTSGECLRAAHRERLRVADVHDQIARRSRRRCRRRDGPASRAVRRRSGRPCASNPSTRNATGSGARSRSRGRPPAGRPCTGARSRPSTDGSRTPSPTLNASLRRNADASAARGSTRDRRAARPCSGRRCRPTVRSRRESAPGASRSSCPGAPAPSTRPIVRLREQRQPGADADAVQPARQKIATRTVAVMVFVAYMSHRLGGLTQVDTPAVLSTRYSSSRSDSSGCTDLTPVAPSDSDESTSAIRSLAAAARTGTAARSSRRRFSAVSARRPSRHRRQVDAAVRRGNQFRALERQQG